MIDRPSHARDTSARAVAGAAVAALLLVLGLVAPAIAVTGPTRLLDPSVPASGRSDRAVTVSVTYRNREGSEPDYVHAIVDGTPRDMTAGSTDWKNGVVFTLTLRLGVGSHTISFEAADRQRFSATSPGGTIAIAAPPAPASTPKPAPKAAPAPTPKPATPEPPAPAPTPASAAGSGTGAGGTATSGGSSPSAAPAGGSEPQGPIVAPGDPGAWPAGLEAPTSNVEPAGPPGSTSQSPGRVATGGPLGSGAQGRPGTDGLFDLAGIGFGGSTAAPWQRILGSLVATSAAVTLAMAFIFFGKRRRDGDPPDSDAVLATAAGTGQGAVATVSLIATPSPAAGIPVQPDAESAMPRWRRPSLLEARKADPLRNASVAVRMSFDRGVVAAVAGLERRLIRYRLVSLLDAPDEVRGAQIGTLDRDDEVQLVERSGAYWRVLCPDGRQGWVHKMTLGDVVSETADGAGGSADEDDMSEVDDDVLSAFLASRGRRT